jgi:hypothetical protein
MRAGDIGAYAGACAKLVPVDSKLELRYRGSNITPGYWRNPVATTSAFDDEVFLLGTRCCGGTRNDPQRPVATRHIAEDFKLGTLSASARAKVTPPGFMCRTLTGINGSESRRCCSPRPPAAR